MRYVTALCLLFLLVACEKNDSKRSEPKPRFTSRVETVRSGTTLQIENGTKKPVKVYVNFGSDSKVTQSDWSPFCTGSRLSCTFSLVGSIPLPLGGKHLNATISFGAPVGCGSTKAELNLNNPKWYDTYDVSLVDGYSNKIRIDLFVARDPKPVLTAGPPLGATGNEKVYGLYPLGCDICTASKNPPCGGEKSSGPCKSGSQYKPDVPCQVQGKKMGGGDGLLRITLVP
jgi:hypothetical protein